MKPPLPLTFSSSSAFNSRNTLLSLVLISHCDDAFLSGVRVPTVGVRGKYSHYSVLGEIRINRAAADQLHFVIGQGREIPIPI